MSERINTPFTNEHFVAFCEKMVGQPYWYGTVAYKCTENLRARKAKQYPAHYGSSRTARYRDDIAKKKVCADCVGLIKGYQWTNGGQGVIESIGTDRTFSSKYGGHGCPDKSANGMFSYAKSKGCAWGTMDTLPEVPGIALRFDGHVGVYIGGGYAVEERGFNYGCVKTKASSRKWTHWYQLPFVDYGDAVPVRPFAIPHTSAHTPVIKTSFLDGIPVSNIHAHMSVKAQCNAGYLGQRVHGSPGAALALRVAEHAVGAFIRTAVATVLAGKGLARADGLDHTLSAVRPLVALDQSHAVGADLLLCNIVPVSGGTAGTVVRRVLFRLACAKIFGAFIKHRAVPVGLTYHLLAECDEVFISERDIDSLAHCCSLSLSSVSSMRPCSCASTDLSFSGIGSPRCAAFSSMDTDSLER